MLRHPKTFAALLAALTVTSCRDSTAPQVGSARYTLTLLPANTVQQFNDHAYFLAYRAGPSDPLFDLGLFLGLRLEFDQCQLPLMGASLGQFPLNGSGLVATLARAQAHSYCRQQP